MPDTLENPTATEPVQAEPDLLPCPWCGTAENVRVDMGHYCGEVTCWNCKGAISWGPEKTTRAEAIAAWNTRPTSDLTERIEGFAEALKNGDFSNVDQALNSRLCCDGHMCGCRGSTVGEYLAYELLAALKEVNSHDRT